MLAYGQPGEWFVHESDHFVTVHAIDAHVMEGAARELASPHDEGSARLTEVGMLHDAPTAAHDQPERDRGEPEIRHILHRDAAAHAGDREHECQYGSRSCRREEATDLGPEVPHPLRVVEAE